MKVMGQITEKLASGRMHMTLLDPDKLVPGEHAAIASQAMGSGTDAIMIGGSTGIDQASLDAVIGAIKKKVSLPVILFPMGARALSAQADAVYFMSLLNSRDPRFLTREQAMGAPFIKKLGIEPIPMGYIVVEPGMKVGEVGQAEPVKRGDVNAAISYALCAQYFGMKLVYLEAGSGAPEPVPAEMVKAVKGAIEIPLIVGGGVRKPEQAKVLAAAGADILVTGTLVESSDGVKRLGDIIKAFKKG
jgi:phosphoglycerol geranylgeranyltransferase